MTDVKELNRIIEQSGLRKRFLAEKLGISHQAFYNKLNGISEFKLAEVSIMCNILNIGKKQREEIFFA